MYQCMCLLCLSLHVYLTNITLSWFHVVLSICFVTIDPLFNLSVRLSFFLNICILSIIFVWFTLTFCLLEPSAPPNNVRGHNSSSTSILVQWNSVPEADQNGDITGYRVIYQPLPSGNITSKTENAEATELDVTLLNEFTNYSICVLAFTVKGDGPQSCITVITAEDSKFQLNAVLVWPNKCVFFLSELH